jgi:hypothetical protein
VYVIRETGRHFGNSTRECLEGEVSDLETCSANKNVRHSYREGINEFKKGYQPTAKSVQNESVICLQIATLYSESGRITSINY